MAYDSDEAGIVVWADTLICGDVVGILHNLKGHPMRTGGVVYAKRIVPYLSAMLHELIGVVERSNLLSGEA